MPPAARRNSGCCAKAERGRSTCPARRSFASIRRPMANLLHPDDTEEEDPVPETPDDPGEFVLADTADDEILAGLLVRAAEEAGIPAILQDPRDGVVGTLASPVDFFRILVPAPDLARAQQIIRARREVLEADPDGASRPAEEAEAEESKR